MVDLRKAQRGARPPCLVITGTPGVGKSTVASIVASRLLLAAHIKADDLHRMIVSGGEWPSAGSPRSREQQLLRSKNALSIARNFQDAGVIAIVDDVMNLAEHADLLRGVDPLVIVGLQARRDVVIARDGSRHKHTAALYESVDQEIERNLGSLVFWIDTSTQSADQIAVFVVELLEDLSAPG